ncbi:hypothetical protein PLICRDRAFT_61651, partial [Plicaturopsis crispa FD-325 SS-3]
NKDYLDVENATEWRVIAAKLKQRGNRTSFKWIKAHKDVIGSMKAKNKAIKGCRKTVTNVDYKIPKEFKVDGARLNTLSQSQAYRLVQRSKRIIAGGIRSQNTMAKIVTDIKEKFLTETSIDKVWTGLNGSHISKPIGDFLWKTIHKRVRCGPYFLNIPNWEDKALCMCGEIETVEHILLDCKENRNHRLWRHIKMLWEKSMESKWIQPDFSTIQGIGAVEWPTQLDEDHKTDFIKTKVYRVLVSEAIWAIWKDRNNRIFQEKRP